MKLNYQGLVDKVEADKQQVVLQLQEKERMYIEKCEREAYLSGKVERLEVLEEDLRKKNEELTDRTKALSIHLDASESKGKQLDIDLKVSRECQEATNTERLSLERIIVQLKEKIKAAEEVQAKLEEAKQNAERLWVKFERRY